MVHTVRKNFEGYINKQVEKDLFSCKVQAMTGRQTEDKFK